MNNSSKREKDDACINHSERENCRSKSKHIDITFDFETCSTAPDAAPMQLAAIVWNRFSEGEHPFTDDTFNVGIDLRTCVVAGFAFDQDTVDFWSRQNETAKQNVTETECYAVDTSFMRFCEWIEQMKKKYGADTVCLWCQGQDFDFPILKTIARKFGLKMPVHMHYFRDCRTYVLETALILADTHSAPDGFTFNVSDILEKPMRAYDLIPKINEDWLKGRSQHDAFYDCMRSTWNVWQCMKFLKR
jgi:hypothetical protein